LGFDMPSEVRVYCTLLESSGRGETLAEANWRPLGENFPVGACDRLNRPVILEDGRVAACCNTTAVIDLGNQSPAPLILGNVKDTSLTQMREKAYRDQLIQAIRIKGPGFVAALLRTRLGDGFYRGAKFREGDICQLCTALMTDPAVV